MDKSRVSAIGALLITGFAIVYAVGPATAGWEPPSGWLIQAIIHMGELSAVAAPAFANVGGRSRVAGVGLAAAMVGQVVIAVADRRPRTTARWRRPASASDDVVARAASARVCGVRRRVVSADRHAP